MLFRSASLKMPEGVRKNLEEGLAKLQGLKPAAIEANVTRNYMDWLTRVYSFSVMHSFYISDVFFSFLFSLDPLGVVTHPKFYSRMLKPY